jgi:hypothetical protein
MLADAPAIAYRASWSDFLNAEFAANFKIDFFTSSRRDWYFGKTRGRKEGRRKYPSVADTA